ncbi:poly(3-hydroxyalkanoate) synthetase [Bradyrhizobium sp. OAE829]
MMTLAANRKLVRSCRRESRKLWPDWDSWMKRHSSGRTPAPVQAGSASYHIIEPAPGRYVKQKSN